MTSNPESAPERRPILITGSHRSGTTWVGTVLAASRSLAYVHEPFNQEWSRPRTIGRHFSRRFTYVTADNESEHLAPLRDLMAFRYSWTEGLRIRGEAGGLGVFLQDWTRCLRARWSGRRPLWKDPIAFFSAEWLAATFDMQVVVMERHPAAFVSSLVRLGWRTGFHELLEQPLLMRDHLGPFEEDLRRHAESDFDLVDEGILLWRMFHAVTQTYRQRHPKWLFVSHEDLARNPAPGFQALCERLHVPFDSRVQQTVDRHCRASNPADPEDPFHLQRNSAASAEVWRDRLDEAQVQRIRRGVEDLADPSLEW